ncbi:MAG: hypothetical protein H6Q68_3596 [Firmicutes bacterium]|nr:hypothetical protein [Bacillota bacterium]
MQIRCGELMISTQSEHDIQNQIRIAISCQKQIYLPILRYLIGWINLLQLEMRQ